LLVEVLKEEIRELVTKSGIILRKPIKDDREDLVVSKAKIIGVDKAHFEKDMTVYFNYFAGNRLVIKGKDPEGKDDIEYLFVHEEDILGVEK